MPCYLTQATYTPKAWKSLLERPRNRIEEVVRPAIEQMGGTVRDSWLTFGEYDVILITEMPDNIGIAAFTMAVAKTGAMKNIKTVPLMTWEEGVQAMSLATSVSYQPPSE